MTGPGTYSVDEISAALSGAAARPGDAEAVIGTHLLALVELLQMNCASFYPHDTSGLTPVHITAQGRRELQVPRQISPSMHDFIASSPERTISGSDPVFTMGHLRSLPA